MTQGNDENQGGLFASPPCYMHEFVDDIDAPEPYDPRQSTDVERWRKAERARLIAERRAIPRDRRRRWDASISAHLQSCLGRVEGLVVGAYWPVRGEPDLRPLLERLEVRGARCALPVVVEFGRPLVFRLWSRDDPLTPGVDRIPSPAEDAPEVVPEVLIAPVVGFDPSCYRLGYGGGFYDRTLAARSKRPRVFGVGYAQAGIPTVFPQWHDIAMDTIVTEDGPQQPVSG